MDNDELLQLIYAEQQRQNTQLQELITTLAAGLGREVRVLGEGKRALRVSSNVLLTELNKLRSAVAAGD